MTSKFDAIPKSDKLGNLPPGCYKADPNKFKSHFVDNHSGSVTRQSVFDGYQKYCHRIVETDSAINQWIDGSFTTDKIDPGDIDLFTIFDGTKLNDDLDMYNEVNELISATLMKNTYKCHGFGVCKYPEEMEVLHQVYKEKKEFYLDYWKTDKKMMKEYGIKIEKGVIEFDVSALKILRGL